MPPSPRSVRATRRTTERSARCRNASKRYRSPSRSSSKSWVRSRSHPYVPWCHTTSIPMSDRFTAVGVRRTGKAKGRPLSYVCASPPRSRPMFNRLGSPSKRATRFPSSVNKYAWCAPHPRPQRARFRRPRWSVRLIRWRRAEASKSAFVAPIRSFLDRRSSLTNSLPWTTTRSSTTRRSFARSRAAIVHSTTKVTAGIQRPADRTIILLPPGEIGDSAGLRSACSVANACLGAHLVVSGGNVATSVQCPSTSAGRRPSAPPSAG